MKNNCVKCPLYDKEIDTELCYETALCMLGYFKLSSVPEIKSITLDMSEAKEICNKCPYSDME